jgi:CubicO group peptidase (beta-lactamase class C family)
MKILLKAILFVFILSLVFISCEIERCIRYKEADINDYKIFPSRTSKASTSKFQFATCPNNYDSKLPLCLDVERNKYFRLEEFLKLKSVVAFLIIHNDSIVYEKYFNNYSPSSPVPSFSVAKSFIATLIGCAIDDGYIKSTDDKITEYVPELKKNGFEKVKIDNLLQMTSGIDFKESYMNIIKGVPAYYYGINLRKKITRLHLKSEPGKKFEYKSADTQLLGLVLERAIQPKTITKYLEEKIWQPLGMEYDATWSIDRQRNGIEKTFCCLNACARDFAKLGRLYLNEGNWNGKQIVSKDWIRRSIQADTCNESTNPYQNSWWIESKKGDFFARGFLGQYIYVNPNKKLVIVRLGEKSAGVDWVNVFDDIADHF